MTSLKTIDEIVADIDAFCARHEYAVTRLGREAVSNPAFYSRLKASKNVNYNTIERVYEFMRQHEKNG